jgi:hypothetical protein
MLNATQQYFSYIGENRQNGPSDRLNLTHKVVLSTMCASQTRQLQSW